MKLSPVVPFALALLSFPIWSQTDSSIKIAELVESVKAAQPIERVPPSYPKNAARRGQEGWVQVSFVVDKQGNVVDPIVEDSSGVKAFESAALKALKNWQYEPAKRGDETIEQCQTRVQLDFRLDSNRQAGVRRTFYRQFKEVTAFLREDKIAEANEAFTKLESENIHNRYENAWFWALDADLALKLNDPRRAIKSAGRAIYSSDQAEYLGKDNLKRMIFLKFREEIKLQWFGEALDTYQHFLEKHSESVPDLVSVLKPYAEEIENVIASDAALIREVNLEDKSAWAYTLTRNRFSLTDLQGDFGSLDIRCDNHRAKYTVETDNIWSIPEAWGTCRVHVNATPQSQFKFVELANQAS